MGGEDKCLHEAFAYLLLPSMGRRSGGETAAEDSVAATPGISRRHNKHYQQSIIF